MLEQDFEIKKQLLLSKLPEYLKSKGINIDANFTCLNPKDPAHLASMRYDENTFTVQCFNCNAQYNIFDLIGVEHSLTNFSQQFAKAYELFVGKLPIGFVEILNRINNEQKNDSLRTHANPVFEIADDFNRNSSFNGFGQKDPLVKTHYQSSMINEDNSLGQRRALNERPLNDESFNNPSTETPRAFNTVSPFDEAKRSPYATRPETTPITRAPQAHNFGTSAFDNGGAFSTPLNSHNSGLTSSQNLENRVFAFNEEHTSSRFNDTMSNLQSPFQNYKPETNYDFSDYINTCASNIAKTSYFSDRGLSDSIIKKYRLGFDENFLADVDNASGLTVNWKAAIIPYGTHGYCVRNTIKDDNKNTRYKKKGHFDIYNAEVLKEPGTIFITEGEFDALSIETLGFKALSLGGTGNVRQLIECIKQSKEHHKFYISLDNDEAGFEATKQIASYLYQLNIEFTCLNLAHPFKDINEALVNCKQMLLDRLNNLDKILAYEFSTITSKGKELNLISTPEDLNTLSVTPSLYTFCARPQVLRRFLASELKNHLLNTVYAGNKGQWDLLANLVTSLSNKIFDKNDWHNIKFLELKNSEDIHKQLIGGIESQTIQGNTSFVVFIDLSAYSENKCIEVLTSISNSSQQMGIPVIALCSSTVSQQVESLSIQNIDISLADNGDFVCKTVDAKGLPVSFIKCNGI